MNKNNKYIEFANEPITEFIAFLQDDAEKWCLGHCLNYRDCFGEVSFEIENIRRCKKIPKIYKLFWEVMHSNIKAISPLILCHLEEKNEK